MAKTHLHLCLSTALAGTMMLYAASGATAGDYLGWANKTPVAGQVQSPPQQQAPAPQQQQQPASYGVPASPYGQVGYPFKTLSWAAKDGAQQQAPVQTIASQMPPPQQQVYRAAPQQAPQPQPAYNPPPRDPEPVAASAPPPPPQPRTIVQNGRTYVLPSGPARPVEPEDDPDYRNSVVSADAAPPAPPRQQVMASELPPPVQQARAEAPMPQVQAQPAPQPAPQGDGAYQVPASSPYAARIAAARAASGQPAPQPTPQPAEAQAQQAATASAPAMSEPLAAEATDHVFIPGEQYHSAADEPRFYSLHRAYGLQPDPITVDRNAGGAILETHFDTQEDNRPHNDASKSDDDSGDDDDTSSDSQP